MNYPAAKGIAILQSNWSDNTPRGSQYEPFTLTNCEWYDIREIHRLNAEFNERLDCGGWHTVEISEAIKAFQNEVSGR